MFKLIQIVALACLVLPAAAIGQGESEQKTSAAETVASPVAPQTLALGLGYPDLRVRYGLSADWSTDAKFVFAEGIQVYSGRLAWNFVDLGPVNFLAGGEGGWAKFDGVEGISGNGSMVGGFIGAEYPFLNRLRLSVDVGPAWLQVSSEGQNFGGMDIIYNTALYFYLF